MKLKDLFDIYCRELKRRKRDKTINDTVAFYNNNIRDRKIAPRLHNMALSKVKRKHIRVLFNEMTDEGYPYKANRLIKILSAAYTIGLEEELVSENIAKGIKRHTEVERERYCSPDELKRVFEILDRKMQGGRSQKGAVFIKLLILTGARKSELARATWGDLRDQCIVLKEHKTDGNKKGRKIFLNESAIAVINTLERGGDEDKIIGINDPRKLWDKIRVEAQIPDVVLHCLRHTYASFALKSKKVSLVEIGNLLGHKSLQSTKRYSHFTEETSIENAELVGEEMFNSIN